MRRLLALALVLVSLMTFAGVAMAENGSHNPWTESISLRVAP